LTVTVAESPPSTPAEPEKVGTVLLEMFPFGGCVSVTAGATESVLAAS
jgi:hypothetical protein